MIDNIVMNVINYFPLFFQGFGYFKPIFLNSEFATPLYRMYYSMPRLWSVFHFTFVYVFLGQLFFVVHKHEVSLNDEKTPNIDTRINIGTQLPLQLIT